MDYSQRFAKLNSVFRLGVNTTLEDSQVDIRFFTFRSSYSCMDSEIIHHTDMQIEENSSFIYPIFTPAKNKRAHQAILLLHGLNERDWNKYLTWAEYLCIETGKPVILFPLAFHVNRSPKSWSAPRKLQEILNLRREKNGNDRSISFANVVLSKRMSEKPLLFYTSGRQTLFDLTHLFEEIKKGNHPLFCENTRIDIFAYSIGTLLAQITLMTNPKQLFSDSKLFMFCGGSIFDKMCGVSRFIMDKEAYDTLHRYYLYCFGKEKSQEWTRDKVFDSFYSMISDKINREKRLSFFNEKRGSIKGILLKKDTVIPFEGVKKAFGEDFLYTNTQLLDFDFLYSHENPFPVGNHSYSKNVNEAFKRVFSEAANFLKS